MQIKHAIFLYFRWILTSEADLKIWPHPGFVEQNALYVETGRIVINLTSNVQNAISTTVMLLPSLFIPVLVVPYSLPSSLHFSSPELAPDSGLQQWFLLPKSMPIFRSSTWGNSIGTGLLHDLITCIPNRKHCSAGSVSWYRGPSCPHKNKKLKSSTCTKL